MGPLVSPSVGVGGVMSPPIIADCRPGHCRVGMRPRSGNPYYQRYGSASEVPGSVPPRITGPARVHPLGDGDAIHGSGALQSGTLGGLHAKPAPPADLQHGPVSQRRIIDPGCDGQGAGPGLGAMNQPLSGLLSSSIINMDQPEATAPRAERGSEPGSMPSMLRDESSLQ